MTIYPFLKSGYIFLVKAHCRRQVAVKGEKAEERRGGERVTGTKSEYSFFLLFLWDGRVYKKVVSLLRGILYLFVFLLYCLYVFVFVFLYMGLFVCL